MSSDRMSYELLLKERDELAREATAAHAELYAVLKQSDYRSADELALDCMARMALEAQQNPASEIPQDLEPMRVKMATAEEIIGGEGADAQKRSRLVSRALEGGPRCLAGRRRHAGARHLGCGGSHSQMRPCALPLRTARCAVVQDCSAPDR
jgi:hypothetical protein